jgi:hypothetical protein
MSVLCPSVNKDLNYFCTDIKKHTGERRKKMSGRDLHARKTKPFVGGGGGTGMEELTRGDQGKGRQEPNETAGKKDGGEREDGIIMLLFTFSNLFPFI